MKKVCSGYHNPKRRVFINVLLAGVLTVSVQHQCAAQLPAGKTLSFFFGASNYDLSGVGWARVYGPRVEFRLSDPFEVQIAVPVFNYDAQFGDRITYLFPEVSLVVSPRVGRVSPYVGFGPGQAIVVAGPGGGSTLTLHLAVGLRVQLSNSWDIRSEGGLRSIDPWSGVTSDISGGIGYRF